ncbi:MAG: hypothetical protein JJ863_25815 [Deltaproteobacteria bacterium]|nr:hypothetical protein [Deltaproteobacteria bacterium]
MKWKHLMIVVGLAGCTVGVDGDYVGLGGAVVGAESAALDAGPVQGEALGLDLEGSERELIATFTVEDEAGPREVRVELDGPVLSMLHGDSTGEARVFVEGLTGPDGTPASFVLMEMGDGRYELRFATDTGNGRVQGTIVLDFVEGHC